MTARFWSILLILGDYVVFAISLLITLNVLGRYEADETYLQQHINLFGPLFCLWLTAFYIEGLYSLRTPSLKSTPVSLLRALSLSVLVSVIFFYLFPNPGITPKRNLVVMALLSFPLSYIWHLLVRRMAASQRLLIKVALLTDEKTSKLVNQEVSMKPWLGFSIVQVLDSLEKLDVSEIDLVIVGRSQMKNTAISQQLLRLLSQNINVMEAAVFTEAVSGKIAISSLDDSWFLEACGTLSSPLSRLLKNTMDKSISILILIIILPIYLVLIPLLLVFSGRPIFFSQIRTGHLDKKFKIWKLRTMIVNAEKSGAQWATPGDARITPIGKFLRKTRLDELPQLWNILNGDMSIVGPRPERPELIESKLAPAIPFYQQRHLVKPGVTGWAQVNFRYGYSADDALEKLEYDLFYVKNQSIWLDIRILLKTAKTVLTGAGQ